MENKFFNGVTKLANMKETENGANAIDVNVLEPIVKWFYNLSDNRSNITSKRDTERETIDTVSYRNSIINTDMIDDIVKNTNDGNKEKVARFLGLARSPRNGVGERAMFRTAIVNLLNKGIFKPSDNFKFCEAVVEYGRWDDLIAILFELNKDNAELAYGICDVIRTQIKADIIDINNGKTNISLLGKWMPSINSSSKATRKMAKFFIKKWDMTNESYRKMISKIRKTINIVETNICQKTFEKIDYSKVPSLAMSAHYDQFFKFDENRFNKYLEDVKNGKADIKSSVITPPELTSKYRNHDYYLSLKNTNDVIEEQWKHLKEVNVSGNVLPVMDLSGSMYSNITDNIQSIDVSVGMGIYLSEHNTGVFKDKAIVFGSESKVLDFSKFDTLKDKINYIGKQNVGYSTNVEDVLQTVLSIAKTYHCSQEEIPTLVFITDTEFNGITYDCNMFETLFETYARKFKENGYQMPRVIFWNTQNRSKTVPITENENGLILMSGFSTNICDMICSNKLDPSEALNDKLNEEWLDKTVYLCE